MFPRSAVLLVATACTGCRSTGALPNEADAGPSEGDAGTSSAAANLYGFELVLDTRSSVSALNGTVYGGETPDAFGGSVVAASEDCALQVPSQPFCDPPCGIDACVDPGRCQPYPVPVSVGSVRVFGVGDTPFTMTPTAGNFFYRPPADVELPYPPAADGAPIRLEAEGGTFEPFVLESEGIAPLTLTSELPVPVATGQAVEVRWVAGASERARVRLDLHVAPHGGQRATLICDVADRGRATLPAELVTALIEMGVSGFPKLVVSRRATGSAVVSAGVVELVVTSTVTADASVMGVISCNVADDCPSDQTCRADLQCE